MSLAVLLASVALAATLPTRPETNDESVKKTNTTPSLKVEEQTHQPSKNKPILLVLPFHKRKIVDKKKRRPWWEGDGGEIETRQLVDLIQHAATDPKVTGIMGVFGVGASSLLSETGWATLEEVQNALQLFQKSNRRHREPNIPSRTISNSGGFLLSSLASAASKADNEKLLLAHAATFDCGTLKDYYLASGFEYILMEQQGELNLLGLCSQNTFLRDALQKHGIRVDVFKHGKFKNAPNMFTEQELTTAHRANVTSRLESMQKNILNEITHSRLAKLASSPVSLRSRWSWWSDPAARDMFWEGAFASSPSLSATEVRCLGLIDGLMPLPDATMLVRGLNVHLMSFDQYAQVVAKKNQQERSHKVWKDRMAGVKAFLFGGTKDESIAVLHLTGDIDATLEKHLVQTIRKIRYDGSTKCVVLRVNSRGGGVRSSETIRRELSDMNLPLVVSMGNVATSGGYYVATGAKRIFSGKKTITGSIGVFSIRPDFTGLANKLGISVEHVSTGALAALYFPFHPITPLMEQCLSDGVGRKYKEFKNLVAKGRGLSLDDVEAIAQGRVWTGEQAREKGLVDEIGGLNRAIDYAQQHFTTQGEATVVDWPKKKTFVEHLAEGSNPPVLLGLAAPTCLFGGFARHSGAGMMLSTMSNKFSGDDIMFYAADENTAIRFLLGRFGIDPQLMMMTATQQLLPSFFWGDATNSSPSSK